MKSITLIVLFCSLLVFTACMKQETPESQQSIQDIVSGQQAGITNKTVEVPKVDTTVKTNGTKVNITKEEVVAPVIDPNEVPLLNKKCRNSAIIYGGCKWTSEEKISFDLKIGSASYDTITGVWMFITGDSGNIKKIKRTEDITSGGIRTYNINYQDLVKEVGIVKRLEVLPIEVVNGTEYTCENQRVYTIPGTYCKNAEATKI